MVVGAGPLLENGLLASYLVPLLLVKVCSLVSPLSSGEVGVSFLVSFVFVRKVNAFDFCVFLCLEAGPHLLYLLPLSLLLLLYILSYLFL